MQVEGMTSCSVVKLTNVEGFSSPSLHIFKLERLSQNHLLSSSSCVNMLPLLTME